MFSFVLLVMNFCTSKIGIAPERVNSLLESGEFTFMAERANPSSYEAVRAMNRLSSPGSSQILNLDYGYTLEIKKDTVTAVLPYFGRMYSANFDQDKNSYRFTSTDFSINEKAGKKGSAIYTILTNDQKSTTRMNLEIFKNGKAYLSISSNDRQPISYDGYLVENIKTKK